MKYQIRSSHCPNQAACPQPGITRARYLLLSAALLALTACGGGGGSSRAPVVPTGSASVMVVDAFDTPVASATVQITSGATTRSGTTSSAGVAVVADIPTGSADVQISADNYENADADVTITENSQSDLSVSLTRQTEPAAGLMGVALTAPLAATDGQTLTFSVQVLVVDDSATTPAAIETLTAADFSVPDCTDTAGRVECLRDGPGGQDMGYTVVNATPANFAMVPGLPAESYAATLVIDQSGSILDSDPSDARLFAHKAYLTNLRAGDFASVSAFAQEIPGGSPALIPDQPVTRLTDFVQSGNLGAAFDALDELADQEGGDTPLFDALDQEMDFTAANAPAGLDRLVTVLFTDGDDTVCDPAAVTECGIAVSTDKSNDLNVDIIAIGLGEGLAVDRLQQLVEGGNGMLLFAENDEQLVPVYRALGEILSRSLSSYQMEFTITGEQAGVYAAGQTILVTLTVDTGSNQINLPLRLFL